MATLAGKAIVVVGGSSGIGFSVAKASLISQASLVIVASSNPARVDNAIKRLEDLVKDQNLSGKVLGKIVDCAKLDDVKRFFAELDRFDHLVWTGAPAPSPLEPGSALAESNMTARFWAPAVGAQSVKEKLLPGGSITFTIGSTVFKPIKGWNLVTGIAGAVDALTRGLAVDMAPIRVNVVSPGMVKTELWTASGMAEEEQQKTFAEAAKRLLVGHVAGPDEIAEAYLYLMKCNYVTGQTLHVEGGTLIT